MYLIKMGKQSTMTGMPKKEVKCCKRWMFYPTKTEHLFLDKLVSWCHKIIWTPTRSTSCTGNIWELNFSAEIWQTSHIQPAGGLFWPHSVIRTLFFIATALLLFGLRAAALAAWAVYKAGWMGWLGEAGCGHKMVYIYIILIIYV